MQRKGGRQRKQHTSPRGLVPRPDASATQFPTGCLQRPIHCNTSDTIGAVSIDEPNRACWPSTVHQRTRCTNGLKATSLLSRLTSRSGTLDCLPVWPPSEAKDNYAKNYGYVSKVALRVVRGITQLITRCGIEGAASVTSLSQVGSQSRRKGDRGLRHRAAVSLLRRDRGRR